METKKLLLTPSPHDKDDSSISSIMNDVSIALIPALLVAVMYFGLGAIKVTLIAVLACLLFEFIIQKFILKGNLTICDGSAVVTGLLLAFNLPSNLPIWMILVGAFVAIGMGKMSFGGLGKNPFNPALVGRVFLLICFPVEMTSWPKPEMLNFAMTSLDGATGATALAIMKEGLAKGMTVPQLMNEIPSYIQLFIGNLGGCIGEVSALALLVGGGYMMVRKVISWHIPVSFLLTVFLMTGLLWLIDGTKFVDPAFHLLTGGLLLGAIFMATDMATSPMTPKGMLIFGFGCGLLTVIIRVWGAYPEGVSFAILIMNSTVPIINNLCKPKRYGTR